MPLGIGESVGTAYVRVVASGDGLDQSIKDMFDDEQHSFETSGGDSATAWQKGFDEKLAKEFKDDEGNKRTVAQWTKDMEKAVAKGAREIEWTAAFFNHNPGWDAFKKTFTDEFGDVGAQAVRNLEAEFRDRGNLSGIAGAMKSLSNDLADAGKDLIKQQEAIDRQQIRLAREKARDLAAINKLVDAEAHRDFTSDIKDVIDATRKLNREVVDFERETQRMEKEQEKSRKGTKESAKGFAKLGDVMQKAFGGGSRNDFLNFFGGFMSIIPRAIDGTMRLAKTFGAFIDKVSAAGEGLQGMEKFGAMMGELVPVMASAAGGIAVVGATLMFVSSVISEVSAAVVALAGTIGMGLVGAIGLAAAALVPLAAGAGIAFLAIKNFSDEQKEALKADMAPLTKAWSGLAGIASKNIFRGLGDDLRGLTPFLVSLAPLMDRASRAVSGQMAAWTQLVQAGAFQNFVAILSRDLPQQITTLGSIMRNVVTMTTGLFSGLSPVLSIFLQDVETLTTRFSNWINSVQGQSAIADFFADGLDAARALGRASLEAVKTVGDLLRLGAKYGGNELFGDAADKFREWGDALTDPANQAAIQGWISDGAEFAKSLGRMAVAVGEFIAALDTPMMRSGINMTLQVMTFNLGILSAALEKVVMPAQKVADGLGKLGFLKWTPVGIGVQAMNGLGAAMEDSGTKAGTAKTEYEKYVQSTGTVTTAAKTAAAEMKAFTAAQREHSAAAAQSAADSRATAESFVSVKSALSGAKQSLEGFISAMNKQATSLINFGNNAKKAATNGLDNGLIASLQKAGPAGASMMAKLAGATDTEIAKANRAWKRGQDAIRDYANMKVPPKKLTIEEEEALSDISAVQVAMDNMRDKTVNIHVATQFSYMNKRSGIPGAGSAAASGGVFAGPHQTLIGEAGPEAVVPLARPLALVDPSVRYLSAIAQGKSAAGVTTPTPPPAARTIIESGAITVVTPASDARAVAWETLNYITAAGY